MQQQLATLLNNNDLLMTFSQDSLQDYLQQDHVMQILHVQDITILEIQTHLTQLQEWVNQIPPAHPAWNTLQPLNYWPYYNNLAPQHLWEQPQPKMKYPPLPQEARLHNPFSATESTTSNSTTRGSCAGGPTHFSKHARDIAGDPTSDRLSDDLHARKISKNSS